MSIEIAYQSFDDIPKFSLSNVISYFFVRTANDSKVQMILNQLINLQRTFFNVAMYVQCLSVVYKNEYWWIKANCQPEMKKGKMYKLMMSLCKKILRYKFSIL